MHAKKVLSDSKEKKASNLRVLVDFERKKKTRMSSSLL
jgi:hypothetical protein